MGEKQTQFDCHRPQVLIFEKNKIVEKDDEE